MIYAYTRIGEDVVVQFSDHPAAISGMNLHEVSGPVPAVGVGSSLRVVNGQFVVEPPTLDWLRSTKKAEINAAREKANSSTFTHQGKEFQVDSNGWKDITAVGGHVGMFQSLPADFPGAWKALDNTYFPIQTVDAFKAFYASMVAQGAHNFMRAQALKTLVDNCTTAEQIESVNWQTPV